MKKGIPINPKILKWARERAGYTISMLTEKDFPKFQDWEMGESYPTSSQLEKLSDKLKISLALFFFPEPPEEEPIEKSLRAISKEDINNLSPNVRFLFRKGKAYQIYLSDLLLDEVNKQNLHWLKNASGNSPQELAEHVRKSLEVSIETQISWSSPDLALSEWRDVFAKKGVYVFKEAFKDDKVSGFCIYDDTYPIIFINNSHSKSRQIYTLFHELGHLISRKNYLDVLKHGTYFDEEKNYSRDEVYCNSFAGHFLVPDESLKEKIQHINRLDIKELAAIYKVSRDVIARRIFEIKKINKNTYQKIMNELKREFEKNKSKEKAKGGGNYYSTRLSYVGNAYCSLVMQKYYQGKIDTVKASEYLDIQPRSFSGMEDVFLRKEAS